MREQVRSRMNKTAHPKKLLIMFTIKNFRIQKQNKKAGTQSILNSPKNRQIRLIMP